MSKFRKIIKYSAITIITILVILLILIARVLYCPSHDSFKKELLTELKKGRSTSYIHQMDSLGNIILERQIDDDKVLIDFVQSLVKINNPETQKYNLRYRIYFQHKRNDIEIVYIDVLVKDSLVYKLI